MIVEKILSFIKLSGLHTIDLILKSFKALPNFPIAPILLLNSSKYFFNKLDYFSKIFSIILSATNFPPSIDK